MSILVVPPLARGCRALVMPPLARGGVSFSGATFGKGHVSFNDATFGGKYLFLGSTLGKGKYSFENVEFPDRTMFHGLKNASAVESFSFKFAKFKDSLEISAEDSFNCVVDLTGTSMSNQVLLENLKLQF